MKYISLLLLILLAGCSGDPKEELVLEFQAAFNEHDGKKILELTTSDFESYFAKTAKMLDRKTMKDRMIWNDEIHATFEIIDLKVKGDKVYTKEVFKNDIENIFNDSRPCNSVYTIKNGKIKHIATEREKDTLENKKMSEKRSELMVEFDLWKRNPNRKGTRPETRFHPTRNDAINYRTSLKDFMEFKDLQAEKE